MAATCHVLLIFLLNLLCLRDTVDVVGVVVERNVLKSKIRERERYFIKVLSNEIKIQPNQQQPNSDMCIPMYKKGGLSLGQLMVIIKEKRREIFLKWIHRFAHLFLPDSLLDRWMV